MDWWIWVWNLVCMHGPGIQSRRERKTYTFLKKAEDVHLVLTSIDPDQRVVGL
jgi:hypothetical protein